MVFLCFFFFLSLQMCFSCNLFTMLNSITQKKKYKLKELPCCMINLIEYFHININNFNRWSNVPEKNIFSQVPPV